MRVVVVDDLPEVANVLVVILARIGGHDASAVTSGFDGLMDEARWEGVDAAIIDYQLGGPVTGLDIARWLHDHLPGRPRRIILTAAYLDRETRAAALAVCDRVFEKPTATEALLEAISG